MDISPIELLLAKLLPIATQKKISLASLIASDDELRHQFLELLTTEQKRVLKWAWWFWARPDQRLPEGNWQNLVFLAGRGWGKTRTSAEACRELARQMPGSRGALIGRSYDDVKKVIVEGESGILAVSPPHDMPIWQPSLKTLTWPNGTKAFVYTGEEPDQIRGHQFHWGVLDEFAAWKYPKPTWDNYKMAARLGDHPRTIVTTTPRPIPELSEIISIPGTIVRSGHTFDNAANLPRVVLEMLEAQYGGTRQGRQELAGELLDASEGALWNMLLVSEVTLKGGMPVAIKRDFHGARAVVGVDPAERKGADNDETGIVVGAEGVDGIGYVLEDLSGHHAPEEWGRLVIQAAARWDARVCVETNRGGDMVISNLRAAADLHGFFPKIEDVTSKDGKFTRAEPVATLYEKRRIRHVGSFAELEKQMTGYVPGLSRRSPDRLDALVIAFTNLLLGAPIQTTTPGQKPRGW
jgi:phage terminase large subunit-like protein